MGWKWGSASLSAAHVRKMWLAAEKNRVRHALFQESVPAILFSKTFNSLRVQRAGKGEVCEVLSWESHFSSNIVRVNV